MTGPGLLEVFARREELLDLLSGGPVAKRDLVREMEVSRSTVDRAMRDLENRGLVERVDGGFRLTLRGALLFQSFERFRARVTGIDEADDVLSVLHRDADLAPAAFEDATVVRPTRDALHRPVDRHLELLEGADRIRTLSTAVMPTYVDAYRSAVVEGGTPADIALAPTIVERLVSDYREAFEAVLHTDRAEVRELDEVPDYSLVLLDVDEGWVVNLLIYAPEGISGLVVNDSRAAVRWAEDTFERYWRSARPYAVPSDDP